MLSISRRVGERIVIGDGIIIEVVAILRGKVRLGIVAPLSTPIFREELLKPKPPADPKPGAPKPPWEE